mgnify:CR=1 FL=1
MFWDKGKLAGTEIEKVLNEKYNGDLREGPVYSDHIRFLIEEYSKDARMIQLAGDLRGAEASIRNIAAHQIASITEEKIKNLTGWTGKQIMDKIIQFFAYTGMGITAGCWKSYDQLNESIAEVMESSSK